jgi:hypothetical protein
MGQIPAHQAALLLSTFCDPFNVEQLACVVVDGTEEEEGNGMPFPFNHRQNVLRSKAFFSLFIGNLSKLGRLHIFEWFLRMQVC